VVAIGSALHDVESEVDFCTGKRYHNSLIIVRMGFVDVQNYEKKANRKNIYLSICLSPSYSYCCD
jgi:hypothetical protein